MEYRFDKFANGRQKIKTKNTKEFQEFVIPKGVMCSCCCYDMSFNDYPDSFPIYKLPLSILVDVNYFGCHHKQIDRILTKYPSQCITERMHLLNL